MLERFGLTYVRTSFPTSMSTVEGPTRAKWSTSWPVSSGSAARPSFLD